jgi:heterodisulfide reductase subunit B
MEDLEPIFLNPNEILKDNPDNPLDFFKDKSICLFKACLEYYYPGIRNCLRELLEDFDFEVKTCLEQSCCSGTFLQRNLITRAQFAAINERNIASMNEIADILIVSCNGCYNSLLRGRNFLRNEEIKDKTKRILKEINKEILFRPKLKVIHVLDFLHLIRENIADKLKYTLKGLKCAVHYGCHYLNLRLDKLDDRSFVAPKFKLEDLIESLGGSVADYQERESCCGWGASQNVIHRDEALKITFNKLKSAENAGANLLVTNCPTCLYTLNKFRDHMQELFGESPQIPAIHINELIGVLMEYECDHYCLTRVSPLIEELKI